MIGTKQLWIAVLGAGLGLAPWASVGQANSVGSSASSTPEQSHPETAIPQEDRATKEQLMKLFEAMRIREQMQTMRSIVPQMVQGQLRQQLRETVGDNTKLSPDQRAAVEKLINNYIERSVNVYSIDEMLGDMTTIYQRYLTREDVDGMIAFYTSPAGQHLLNAQPKIAKDYMPVVMQRAQERSRALTTEMMKDLAAIKQQSAPSGTSPAKQ
jgi:hypothetical protein